MIRFYPFVIMIQIFCLYHAYTNKTEQKWFWIIVIFPFVGSLFYLYDHFYSRRNLELIKEEVKGSLIQNYSIDKLEQKVKFSQTYANKLELANEHLNIGNLDRAIEIFESCNRGTYRNDVHLNMKLMQSYYLKENHEKVLEYGEPIVGKKEFSNSPAKIALAWSNYRLGRVDDAEKLFSAMDIKFSNYEK